MSEDADFNAYQEYGKDPDVSRIREEVKRKFRESLEALIEKVNKQIQEELHIDDKTQSELDEAAKEFLRRPEVSAVPYCTGPNTPLLDCRIHGPIWDRFLNYDLSCGRNNPDFIAVRTAADQAHSDHFSTGLQLLPGHTKGYHGRWELLTPEDVRFLIDCGYLID